MGSALFSLFCPLSIKNYASPIDYINGEASLLSSARIKIMLPDITYQYSYWLGDLGSGPIKYLADQVID